MLHFFSQLAFRQYYANFVSLWNLLFWLFSLVCIVYGEYILAGFFFIISLICDLFDGKLARMFWSTKHGDIVDDIADGVTFWLLPGIALVLVYGISDMTLFLMILYIGSVFFRLWRFVAKDKKNKKIKQGNFSWLPSPAGALIVLSSTLWEFSFLYMIGIVCIVSFLMVSTIPFAHFWKVFLKKMKKRWGKWFIMLSIGVAIFTQITHTVFFFFLYTFSIGILYVVLAFLWRVR